MEMHQVRYFLAVSETLNFTRAAEQCGVAQPSLTKAIKRLEEEGEYLVFGTEPVTTSSLVEDELLLALPMVPTHPGCHAAVSTQQGAPEPEQETHRPFAGLAELRGLRTNDEQE